MEETTKKKLENTVARILLQASYNNEYYYSLRDIMYLLLQGEEVAAMVEEYLPDYWYNQLQEDTLHVTATEEVSASWALAVLEAAERLAPPAMAYRLRHIMVVTSNTPAE